MMVLDQWVMKTIITMDMQRTMIRQASKRQDTIETRLFFNAFETRRQYPWRLTTCGYEDGYVGSYR